MEHIQLFKDFSKYLILASIDEYEDVIVFLASDSSAYMTVQSIIMDGGKSV